MLDFYGTGYPYGGGYGGYGGYGYGGQTSKDSKIIGSMKVHAVTIGLGRRIVWPDDFFIISNSLLYYNYDLSLIHI